MTPEINPETYYKIHCLEKENNRLMDAVKQIRQNALAFMAAVIVLGAQMVNISKPLVGGLKKAQYEGTYQAYWMGSPETPERDIAIQHLTLLWNLTTLIAMVSGVFTIILAVWIFLRTGRYAPILRESILESMNAQKYIELLKDQYIELRRLTKGYRWRLACAACFALLTVAGCGVVTTLWLLFGGAPESATKAVGGP